MFKHVSVHESLIDLQKKKKNETKAVRFGWQSPCTRTSVYALVFYITFHFFATYFCARFAGRTSAIKTFVLSNHLKIINDQQTLVCRNRQCPVVHALRNETTVDIVE